jgi:hypothetical protein
MTAREESVKAAIDAMIDGLGTLTPRQQVVAATACRVAANLDAELDGSKAAALSRELRQLVVILQPVAGVGPTARKDPIAALQDEVGRKRRQREQGA